MQFVFDLSGTREKLPILLCLTIFLVGGPLSVFLLFYGLSTNFWWVSCLYGVWWVLDVPTSSSGGRRGQLVSWAKNLNFMKGYRDYFPITLIKTAELDPSEKHIICSHPHGILPWGVAGCFASEAEQFSVKFPGMVSHITTLEGNLLMPLFREVFLLFGAVSSSRKSLDYLLQSAESGHVPVLIIGGVPEMENYEKDKIRLFLEERKGFIKLALRHGANLVPTFSFGETSLYRYPSSDVNIFNNIRKTLKEFLGWAPVTFYGRGWFQSRIGVMPERKPINVVMGSPIKVTKVVCPSEEEINDLHQQYVKELIRLYDTHNKKYGDENVSLVIN